MPRTTQIRKLDGVTGWDLGPAWLYRVDDEGVTYTTYSFTDEGNDVFLHHLVVYCVDGTYTVWPSDEVGNGDMTAMLYSTSGVESPNEAASAGGYRVQ